MCKEKTTMQLSDLIYLFWLIKHNFQKFICIIGHTNNHLQEQKNKKLEKQACRCLPTRPFKKILRENRQFHKHTFTIILPSKFLAPPGILSPTFISNGLTSPVKCSMVMVALPWKTSQSTGTD